MSLYELDQPSVPVAERGVDHPVVEESEEPELSEILTAGSELGSVWDSVDVRLRALLRQRGVDRHGSDDIVQEVAVRALSHRVAFSDADDLYRWASVVARRLTIDGARRRQRRQFVTLDETITDPRDVESAFEDRARLAALHQAVAELSPADRITLYTTTAINDAERRRLAVRRHRLRKRLTERVRELSGGFAAWVGRRRWLHDPLAQSGANVAAAIVSMAVVVSCASFSASESTISRTSAIRDGDSRGVVERPTLASSPPESTEIAGGAHTHVNRRASSVLPDVPDQRVMAPLPGGSGVSTRDRTEEDRVVCVEDNPVIGTWCTPL